MKHHSPPVTIEMAGVIKLLVIQHGYLQHEAAAVYGINQGRVSEVMTGKLYPDVPPASELPTELR